MADLKITEMTDAGDVNNADLLPLVQAGANVKATRETLLTGASGEDITLQGSDGQAAKLQGNDIATIVHCTDDVVGISAETSVVIASATPTPNNFIQIDTTGIFIVGGDACMLRLTIPSVGAGKLQMGVSNTIVVSGFESVQIQITDLDDGMWVGTPLTIKDAIQRIANVVSAGGSTPIPDV